MTLTVFCPMDQAPYINVVRCEEKFLTPTVTRIIYGTMDENLVNKEERDELIQELLQERPTRGYRLVSLEDGWIAMARDESGVYSFFLDRYKDMREDRDYEGQERVKYIRRSEKAEGELDIIRTAFNLVAAKCAIDREAKK